MIIFLCVLKCSVNVLILDVRIATWTSGDPVSPSFVANSFKTLAFSSAVIDNALSSYLWYKPGCRPARPLLIMNHFTEASILIFPESEVL